MKELETFPYRNGQGRRKEQTQFSIRCTLVCILTILLLFTINYLLDKVCT
jgi:hypothetical protein